MGPSPPGEDGDPQECVQRIRGCTDGGGWGTEARRGGVSGSKEGFLETWHSEGGWFRHGRPGSDSTFPREPEPDPVQGWRPAVRDP